MKKLTLISIILFLIIIGYIFIVGISKNKFFQNSTATNTGQTASSSGLFFTSSDVAQHSTEISCYLIINKQVYDVTLYINQHPGGKNKIISNCGKEVTGIFAAIHSNFAWNLLKSYYIGDLK